MARKKTGRGRTLRVNLSLDPKVLAMADRQAAAEGRPSRSAHIAELIKAHEDQMKLMGTGQYAADFSKFQDAVLSDIARDLKIPTEMLTQPIDTGDS